MRNEIAAEWLHAVVNIAADFTTIYSGPVLLRGIYVNTTLSAHVVPVRDNSVTIFSIPASTAAGTFINCMDVRMETNLQVDPDNVATGNITVVYKPNHEGLAGSGA